MDPTVISPGKFTNEKIQEVLLRLLIEDCLWADMLRNDAEFPQHGPLSRPTPDEDSCKSRPPIFQGEEQYKRNRALSLGGWDYNDEVDLDLLIQVKWGSKGCCRTTRDTG